MRIKKTMVVALAMAVLSAVPASMARADESDKLTYLTFSKVPTSGPGSSDTGASGRTFGARP